MDSLKLLADCAIKSRDPEEIYICHRCSYTTYWKEIFEKHFEKEHSTIYVCHHKKCNFNTDNFKEFEKHLNKHS